MKIIEVNYNDLLGRIYNGYDLHLSLIKQGYDAKMIVKTKYSDLNSVIQLKNNYLIERQLKNLENSFSMSNITGLYGKYLEKQNEFISADIVHYHILHIDMISLLDLPILMNKKPSVWTIHDPWIITGNCVHPTECMCEQWRQECVHCNNLDYMYFEMQQDKVNEMWHVKKEIYSHLDVEIIVATDFMKDYIENSPLTKHFKKIHKIPFGVKVEEFDKIDKHYARKKYNIQEDKFVVSFRNEEKPLKGCSYILEALSQLNDKSNIVIVTVGFAKLPQYITDKFRTIEFGCVKDDQQMKEFYAMCDVFLMPSIAESFGLMAVEAMAARCAVICFKDTVLEEITESPICGIAVENCSSEAIRYEIDRLRNNLKECVSRGKLGREIVEQKYRYEEYVKKHIEVYNSIYQENNGRRISNGE